MGHNQVEDEDISALTTSALTTSAGTDRKGGNVNGEKHGALHPQKPERLIRDGKVEGSGIFISNT